MDEIKRSRRAKRFIKDFGGTLIHVCSKGKGINRLVIHPGGDLHVFAVVGALQDTIKDLLKENDKHKINK